MKERILSSSHVLMGYLDKHNLVDINAVKNFILNESELFLQRHEKRYKDFYLDYNDQVDWINKEVVAKVRAKAQSPRALPPRKYSLTNDSLLALFLPANHARRNTKII